MFLIFPDCIRYFILDSFQPHNDMGFIAMVLHLRLLLQLLYRWHLCWFTINGNAGSQFLVYNCNNSSYLHCSCASLAFLLRRCIPKFIRPCQTKATNGTNEITTKSRCSANTISQKNEKIYSVWLCLCTSRRLRQAYYLG